MIYKISSELINLYRKAVTDLKNTNNKDFKNYSVFLASFKEINTQVLMALPEQKQDETYGADDLAEFYLQLWHKSKIKPSSLKNKSYQNLLNLLCAFQDYTQECDETLRYTSADMAQGLTYFMPEINEKISQKKIQIPKEKNIKIAMEYFAQLAHDENEIVRQEKQLKVKANRLNASRDFWRNSEERHQAVFALSNKKTFQENNPGQSYTLDPESKADRLEQIALDKSQSFIDGVNKNWQASLKKPIYSSKTSKKQAKTVSFISGDIQPDRIMDEKIIPAAALLSKDLLQLEFASTFLSENTANYYQATESNQLPSETIDLVTQMAGYIFKRIKERQTTEFNEHDEYEIGGRGNKNYRLDPNLPAMQSIALFKNFLKRRNDISDANCNLILSLLLQTRVGIQFQLADWLNAFLMPLSKDFSNSDTIIKHSSQLSISINYKEIGSATLNFELPVVCGSSEHVEKVGKSNFSVEVTHQGIIKFSPVCTELYDTKKTELNRLRPFLNNKEGTSSYQNVPIESSVVKPNEPGQMNQPRKAPNAVQKFFYRAVNFIRKGYEYFGLLKPRQKPFAEKSIFRFDIKPTQANLLAQYSSLSSDIEAIAETLAEPIPFKLAHGSIGLNTEPPASIKNKEIFDNNPIEGSRISIPVCNR